MYSGSSMRSSSTSPASSKMHSSTLVALAENSAKLTPRPSQVAPSGKGSPSRIREASITGGGVFFFGRVIVAPAKDRQIQRCGSLGVGGSTLHLWRGDLAKRRTAPLCGTKLLLCGSKACPRGSDARLPKSRHLFREQALLPPDEETDRMNQTAGGLRVARGFLSAVVAAALAAGLALGVVVFAAVLAVVLLAAAGLAPSVLLAADLLAALGGLLGASASASASLRAISQWRFSCPAGLPSDSQI
ncbi:hypothetical protein EMIT0P228_20460 [Pseudomonas brassicacearum]